MIKDFSSLAEASEIIDNIQQKATVQFKANIRSEGATAVEKILSYLSEFLEPLYNCKALEDHCLASVNGVSIVNTKDYDYYNQTKRMRRMYVLGLNIPLGGHGEYLKLIFRKDEPVSISGSITERTLRKLVVNWHQLKCEMGNHCEGAIQNFNRNCKLKVDELAKLQEVIKNFEV